MVAPMPTLASFLTDPSRRERVLDDCVRLVDEEVDSKGGLSGIGIKTAYAVVKRIKPGFVRGALNAMLDDFSARLDPLFQDHLKAGSGSVVDLFTRRKGDVAEALLSITDDRARRSSNGAAKSAYEKLRPTGKKHVEEAVPRLARMIETHTR
jgi:uncharacterized protein DUF6918